jgi:hypothetical protein
LQFEAGAKPERGPQRLFSSFDPRRRVAQQFDGWRLWIAKIHCLICPRGEAQRPLRAINLSAWREKFMGLANTPVAKAETNTATARPVTIFSESVIFVFVIFAGVACVIAAVFHTRQPDG